MLSAFRSAVPRMISRLTRQAKSLLLVVSLLPAVTLSILVIIIAPGFIGAYVVDILFWVSLALALFMTFIIAGSANYRMLVKKSHTQPRRRWYIFYSRRSEKLARMNYYIAIVWAESIIVALILFHLWLHMTNPYAGFSVVEQPYITKVNNGRTTVQKKFDLHVFSGPFAEALGYYKSGFLIVQNSWFGSYPAPSHSANAIIDDIHKLRFDPSKPYLISGDQFSVLYPRNLGVFYNSILDYRTARSQQDWQNRQQIYLQSALYALDAFSSARHITTTIVPVGPRSAVLTEVHPGSIASDSLYGILYAFEQLENANKVQTTSATKQIIAKRKDDLRMLLSLYQHDVRDPATGLVKRGIHLAAARDGVLRDSSFYDNVILWKTLDLADKLGIQKLDKKEVSALRTKIIKTFWLDKAGYFKDDQISTNYSSDWLITLPTGFLSATNPEDRTKIERIIAYVKKEQLDQPFPIKYSTAHNDANVPWAVKNFVPNYGGTTIWSYWGAQYIDLLGAMYHETGNGTYKKDAEKFIDIYRTKIEQTHGFPETFDVHGNFLENPVYKSIRQTGWVVEFETAEAEFGEL